MPKKKELPGDWFAYKIFHEYGSAEFVDKLKGGFTKELEQEWIATYMNGVGLVTYDDFFTKIMSWRHEYEQKYPLKTKKYPVYELLAGYMIPLCAPKFIDVGAPTQPTT